MNDTHLQCYQANLTALCQADPQLASRVEVLPIPATVEPAIGRDGSETFRIRDDDAEWHWLGRSSMPSVSTAALLGGFVSQGRNVILPGVGTGREAPALAARCPAHCAVLVWEPDLLALKLALHLEDYSTLIAGGRLVLFSGQDLVEALVEVFDRSAGLEFPHRMLPLPTANVAQQDRTRMLLEEAGRRVTQRQAETCVALSAELKERIGFDLKESPRLAILSRDPRAETLDLAARCQAAADRLGWAAARAVPDRADACHVLSRLQLVHRHQPDLVLLLNCVKGPLGSFLPPTQPTCAWLITQDSIEALPPDGLDGQGPIFVAQPAMVDRLVQAGARREQIHLLERATDPAVYHPNDVDPGDAGSRSCQVMVVADGFDLAPAAASITLASHLELWKALCRRTERVIGQWHDGLAEQVFSRAERDCGLRLTGAELRGRFLLLVRQRLAPTLLARTAVERCVAGGLSVAVWGAGWDSHPSVSPLVQGCGADPTARNSMYATTPVVLCPWYGPEAVQTVLDCLAAGGCPVFLKPERRLKELHPQLGDPLGRSPAGGSVEQLVSLVKRLAADADARRSATEQARNEVLQRHTLTARLTTIRQVMLRP